uniref:Uncharacterized protein n=1 Tax=Rhizophora mucronata TaxID=61149 RepID=A0A2P2J4X1_RHIMU
MLSSRFLNCVDNELTEMLTQTE